MAEKKIIIEPEIIIGDISLIPIVELTTACYYGRFGLYFYGNKKPLAVILTTHHKKRLYILGDISPEVDKLLSEMPQLSAILES
jgi:hypothetical protein